MVPKGNVNQTLVERTWEDGFHMEEVHSWPGLNELKVNSEQQSLRSSYKNQRAEVIRHRDFPRIQSTDEPVKNNGI